MTENLVLLDGHHLSAELLVQVSDGAGVELCQHGLDRMSQSREILDIAIAEKRPVYGVTTGLGPKVTDAMPSESVDQFSINTIRGRAHAVGKPMPVKWARAAMAVRINTLLLGASGARPELATHLANCLNANLAPVIPETGSIGVADLGWGAAMGRSMIGEGEMLLEDGEVVDAEYAMQHAGISAFEPKAREGLALVSHSSTTAALAAVAMVEVSQCLEAAQTTAALSMEGFCSNLSPLDERVLALRPQPGQQKAAAGLRRRLHDSILFSAGSARRLQDPLSLRNVAQVHGAVFAVLESVESALACELNGASDNPAVLVESGEVLSHGGYLPPYLSVMLAAVAQSTVHLAALQLSRISKLLFNRFSDLPNGLSSAGAEGAGMSPLMKTAEALFAEISHLATPPPIYPGISADGLEDVVTHASIPAKALITLCSKLRYLCAIEAIVANQAILLRESDKILPYELALVCGTIREMVSHLESDRSFSREIEVLAAKMSGKPFVI